MTTTVIATNSGARLLFAGNQLIVTRTGTIAAGTDGILAIDAGANTRIVVDGGVYGGTLDAIGRDPQGQGDIDIVVGVAGTVTALAFGTSAIKFDATLSVNNAGFISGAVAGVNSNGGALSLVNAGTISGQFFGVLVSNSAASSVIVNSGVIAVAEGTGGPVGAVDIETSAGATLINSGTILGGSGFAVQLDVDGGALVINDGVMLGNSGATNSGVAFEVLSTGNGNDTVVNRGDIEGGEIRLGAGNDFLDSQTGRTGGRILLDFGNDTALGGALGERVDGGSGNDLVLGAGGDDSIAGGIGNDILSGGEDDDRLDGGTNDDTLDAGAGRDTVLGGDGADDITAGSGDDLVEGGAGADLLLGGEGAADVLSYATSNLGVTVNLSTGDAQGGHADGDVYAEFEGAWGSNLADNITGTLQANLLRGLGGDDRIFGLSGNDRILGDGGNDTLAGGAGQDLLWGGSGVDRFVFGLASETGVTGATRDWIMDFSQPLDERIDLGLVDANTGIGGNQDFTFIGAAAFSGTAGELRSTRLAAVTLVQGDVNGDAVADLSIMLRGALTLSASDFILGLGVGG